MDEARRVIDRLGRIDALRSSGAGPRALLPELRQLVREGEEWVTVEGGSSGTARAFAALEALDSSLAEGSSPAARQDAPTPAARGLSPQPGGSGVSP